RLTIREPVTVTSSIPGSLWPKDGIEAGARATATATAMAFRPTLSANGAPRVWTPSASSLRACNAFISPPHMSNRVVAESGPISFSRSRRSSSARVGAARTSRAVVRYAVSGQMIGRIQTPGRASFDRRISPDRVTLAVSIGHSCARPATVGARGDRTRRLVQHVDLRRGSEHDAFGSKRVVNDGGKHATLEIVDIYRVCGSAIRSASRSLGGNADTIELA